MNFSIQNIGRSILLVSILLFTACKTNKTTQGAIIGGAAGGVLGGVIGKKSGNSAAGIIIGAAIGGTAGAIIGRYMDKQAEEIEEDLKNAKVKRVGEGILITFDAGLMFDVDSYQLKSATRRELDELSTILNKYEDTDILVEGHTDSSGAEDYNQALSVNRAKSVYQQLQKRNVTATRVTTVGYGELQPIADNGNATGRQKNRRVEVAIYANKKLKRAAKRGDIPME